MWWGRGRSRSPRHRRGSGAPFRLVSGLRVGRLWARARRDALGAVRAVLVGVPSPCLRARHSLSAPPAAAPNMARTVPFSVWPQGWGAFGARAARRVGAVWAAMWARNAPAPRPSSAARARPGSRTLSDLNGSARLRTGSTRSCARRSAVKTDLGARTHHGDTRGASGHPMRQSAGPWEGPPRHLGGARCVL